MFSRVSTLVLVLGVVAPAGRAAAGWVTIKNDTAQPVVVQETVVVNKQVRRAKPVTLQPGEVLREFQACPGVKTLEVTQAGGEKKPLAKGELAWAAADQAFAVRSDGTAVSIQPDAPVAVAARTARR